MGEAFSCRFKGLIVGLKRPPLVNDLLDDEDLIFL
jgi:hypothetical protein